MNSSRIIIDTDSINYNETCPRCGGGMHSSRSVCIFCEDELYKDGCEGYDGSGESFADLFLLD